MSDKYEDIDEPVDDDAFDALVAQLPHALRDPTVWAEPPPWLADSIVAAIADERAEAAPVVAAPAGPARARRPRRPRQTWWLAAAAAVVAIVAAVGIIAIRDGGGGEEFAMAGTDLARSASATGQIDDTDSGLEITLDIQGLPPAPDGFFYEAWMRTEDDENPDLTAIGTFHMRGGDSTVTLWSAVDIDTHPIITVTLQEEGAGPESSGQVVLRGSLVDEASG
jgi:hypothetical protein